MNPGPWEIRIARSRPAVEALRNYWATWPGQRDSDIDFFLTIVGSYPEVIRPHVVVLYRNGEPEAILVGRLEQKQLTFRVGYVDAFRRRARCLTFVYGAVRGHASAENVQILVRSVMSELKRHEADLAILESVAIDLPLYRSALKLPGILSRDMDPAPQEHHVMLLPDNIDHIYRRMSHDRRKDMRRKIKKFQASPEGPPRIVRYRSESELDVLFQVAEEIAKKTYQRGLGAGFADTPNVRERLRLAAQRGWLRAYVLYLGDHPCAFWIGMLYGETFLGEYVGYDPEFRQSSPGTFLTMRVIESFCNREHGDLVKELDFGLGGADYKAVLCDKNWREAVVHIFAPTPSGFVLKLMRITAAFLDTSAKRLLKSSKLLPRLKRAWRDRLARREGRLAEATDGKYTPIPRPVAPEPSSSSQVR